MIAGQHMPDHRTLTVVTFVENLDAALVWLAQRAVEFVETSCSAAWQPCSHSEFGDCFQVSMSGRPRAGTDTATPDTGDTAP